VALEKAFARRVQVLRDSAGDRLDDIELNLFVAAVGETADALDLTIIRQASGLDDRQLSQLPGVLAGSPREIADRLQRYREEYGISYISVLEPHMAAFAKVIKHLRPGS
jgi:alkanesulfonate monooxygenase SsuD/methylene tetrahydromethanopterin reductase-like flavin-dependent oxidoreductase (luciferase family)